MNKKERRLNELVGLLNEQPNLSVRNLAGILNVSEMTIRRDLNFMNISFQKKGPSIPQKKIELGSLPYLSSLPVIS